MKIKVWDKKEPINGVQAEDYLKDNYIMQNTEILLFLNDNGIVEQVQSVNILKSILNLDDTVSAIDVGNKYLEPSSNKDDQVVN